MLISQGPLRVSLLGGGSDLPTYLERNTGAVLSFAIDRRVFIIGHPFTHREGIQLKYSKTENVNVPGELEHPIARVILDRYGIRNMDIAVMADVPAGTGLGSSSSFTVAFIAMVRHMRGIATSAADLAREACEVEIDILNEPIGYQDQWASALGGVNVLTFHESQVEVESLTLSAQQIESLESNIHLIPVGEPRSASDLLAQQSQSLTAGSEQERSTQQMVEMVQAGREALLTNVDALGPLLAHAWDLKKCMGALVSNPVIDELYDRGLRAGATGGKLLGAGGSGYLAFYVPGDANAQFRSSMPNELEFRIANHGAGVIHDT